MSFSGPAGSPPTVDNFVSFAASMIIEVSLWAEVQNIVVSTNKASSFNFGRSLCVVHLQESCSIFVTGHSQRYNSSALSHTIIPNASMLLYVWKANQEQGSPQEDFKGCREGTVAWSSPPHQSLLTLHFATSKENQWWRHVGPTCIAIAGENTAETRVNTTSRDLLSLQMDARTHKQLECI